MSVVGRWEPAVRGQGFDWFWVAVPWAMVASLLEYFPCMVITGFVFHSVICQVWVANLSEIFSSWTVRVPVGKRRNGGHAVRAPCAASWRAALKSSDFDVSIVLVADQAVLGLCSEPRSSGGLVRSGEAKCRGSWHAGARAPGLRCGGCRSVFRGGRSSCHGNGWSVVFKRKWCCSLTYAFMCILMHACAFICISLFFACIQTRCILQFGCIRTHFATTLSCCILPMRDGCILMHFHTCCILDMLHFHAFSCIQKVRFMLMHSPRDAYVA